VLERLRTRDDGPFVVRLPREAGRREARYMHLFSGEPAASDEPASPLQAVPPPAEPAGEDRLAALERAVADLQMEVAELKRKLAP